MSKDTPFFRAKIIISPTFSRSIRVGKSSNDILCT